MYEQTKNPVRFHIIKFNRFIQFWDHISRSEIRKTYPNFHISQLDFNTFAIDSQSLGYLDELLIYYDIVDYGVTEEKLYKYFDITGRESTKLFKSKNEYNEDDFNLIKYKDNNLSLANVSG